MKQLRWVVVLAGLLAATAAFAGEASEGLIGIQVTNGTGDFVGPQSGGYLSAYDHSEIGVGIQYWRLMSRDYAFAFSAGIGTFADSSCVSAYCTPPLSEAVNVPDAGSQWV